MTSDQLNKDILVKLVEANTKISQLEDKLCKLDIFIILESKKREGLLEAYHDFKKEWDLEEENL